MTKSKNSKPLTDQEKENIRKLCLIEGYSDEQIAQELGINKFTVIKWRKRYGIIKDKAGDVNLKRTTLSRHNINKSSLSDEDKAVAWLEYFKTTPRYLRLHKQLLPEDLEAFVQVWCAYCLQFDDMKPSEEEQLEMLITYKIRIDHNRSNYKKLQLHEQDLQRQLAGRSENAELSLENEADRFIYEMSLSNNQAMREINTELKELTSEHDKHLKALNATREQREQSGNVGSDSFLSLVKSFNERDKKREAGKYNELMKMATQKKMQEMKEIYQFDETMAEPLLLTGSDYKNKIAKEKSNGKK